MPRDETQRKTTVRVVRRVVRVAIRVVPGDFRGYRGTLLSLGMASKTCLEV